MPSQRNRIDLIRPDAPALSVLRPWPVGVQTHTFAGAHDRALTVEIWYPTAPGNTAATPPGTVYETILRDGVTATTLHGTACRDAPCAKGMKAPLIVISHGFPGNRFLLSHLAESLAAQGFVVAAPDHPGSTYADQQAFGITLLNRPLDQRAVIDGMATLGGDLGALTDADATGLIGYSMGGYGALILGGAGVADTALAHENAPVDGSIARHLAGSRSYAALGDPRLRAILPIGPWGNSQGIWDPAGLAGLRIPMLLMAGTVDNVSDYAAMRGIFTATTGTSRHLLSFVNAGHNAAAPIPAPAESWAHSDTLGWPPFRHYADPVWDTVRMNNIAQHFAAAFFGLHLRHDTGLAAYLDGTHWPGFEAGTAVGLSLEHLEKGATT